MFTLAQYFSDARLLWGVIADVLFFGSLWWGYSRMKAGDRDE